MVKIDVPMNAIERLCPYCSVRYDDFDTEHWCMKDSECGSDCSPKGDCAQYFGRSLSWKCGFRKHMSL